MGKFKITKQANGDYRFVLKADNGETILSSQPYAFKSSCENGINAVRNNAPDHYNFERKMSENGKFYFTLKAGNGQVIGTSELYESEQGLQKGIDSVKNNAPDAMISEEH